MITFFFIYIKEVEFFILDKCIFYISKKTPSPKLIQKFITDHVRLINIETQDGHENITINNTYLINRQGSLLIFLYLFKSINKTKIESKNSKNLKRRVAFIQKNQNISSTSIIYRFIIMFKPLLLFVIT